MATAGTINLIIALFALMPTLIEGPLLNVLLPGRAGSFEGDDGNLTKKRQSQPGLGRLLG